MAAKYYNHRQYVRCHEIKELDNSYWSNYSDTLVFKNNIGKVSDEKYPILATRLDESHYQVEYFKERISVLFKATFV